jgi:RES domain-containing protein
MIVYRLSKTKYGQELSGKGAAMSNNRWNTRGTEIIYTAESRALALTEVLVHLSIRQIPNEYVMMEITIPEGFDMQKIAISNLESGWNSFPPGHKTMRIGDAFIAGGEFLILAVPSAVVPGDYNYLINPRHAQFRDVQVKSVSAFPFDTRLLK